LMREFHHPARGVMFIAPNKWTAATLNRSYTEIRLSIFKLYLAYDNATFRHCQKLLRLSHKKLQLIVM
jgi:hypothetical protein